MIRVIFVIDHLEYGGAQKMLTFVANHLDKERYVVAIYLKNGKSKKFYHINENVEIIYGKKRKTRYIRRFQEIIDLISGLKRYKPEIIISFLNVPNFISSISGFLCRVPVIISERGDPGRNATLVDKAIRHIECISNGAVFQTDGARRQYPKVLAKKGTIIPNPVVKSTQKNYIFNPNYKKIAFVARFEMIQKRQDIMLYAFSEVVSRYPDIKLYFYGDGPDETKCKNMAHELNISNNIEFCGRVERPIDQMLDAYMFVLTSDYEGIPNSLIEAMSLGVPVVATDCTPGGAALLINNKNNGILVPRGSAHEVAKAMTYLLDNPSQAEKYGENARKVIEKYSEEKIIKMWDDYIETVVKRKGLEE